MMDEGGTPLLPDSLVYQIFPSLGPADLGAAGLVCRQWQAVPPEEFLWREQFYRYYQQPHPAMSYDTAPCMEVQTLREHTDQVLHLSFSHSGYPLASCSKDCNVKIWNNHLTISLVHRADLWPSNWSYTQFSQFNQDDPRLLASGDVESENVNVVKRIFKIQNLNASTIRTVMVVDCGRLDSPDLLLDISATPGCVFDLGSDGIDENEEEEVGPAPVQTEEGFRRLLDWLLDTQAQLQLAEHTLETKVVELLAQGRTKSPERSTVCAQSKLVIFTHQIGNKRSCCTR
uniref:F-box domain-containing protein n=1 Tax=Molossus molossus TaxID=27622 RepID=A0A7J8HH33_MOLMO|nr:hypothetical protein HJG59_011026 [Molossus molossus]